VDDQKSNSANNTYTDTQTKNLHFNTKQIITFFTGLSIGLIVGFVTGRLTITSPSALITSQTQDSKTFPSPSPKSIEATTLTNTPPLYSKERITWISDASETWNMGNQALYFRDSKNMYDSIAISGDQFIYIEHNLSDREAAFERDFLEEYYVNSFSRLNWFYSIETENFEVNGAAASGPTGGTYGYIGIKNNELRTIIYSYRIIHKKKDETALPLKVTCPCDIELRVFISDITPVDDLLKEAKKKPL